MTTSIATIGSSAASEGADAGALTRRDRRSAAMRAAIPAWPLTIPISPPNADARKVQRRDTVDPAAPTHNRQASERASSAASCRTTAKQSSQTGAVSIAARNTSRRLTSTTTSTATATTGESEGDDPAGGRAPSGSRRLEGGHRQRVYPPQGPRVLRV